MRDCEYVAKALLNGSDVNFRIHCIDDGKGGVMRNKTIVCNQCGAKTNALDAGFDPVVHHMKCGCGGEWVYSTTCRNKRQKNMTLLEKRQN